MLAVLHRLRPTCDRPAVPPARTPRLACTVLEDRTTPTVSAITSSFNGTAIAAGNSLWISSVAKVSGVPASGATLHITQATVSAAALGTIAVPDATVRFDPAATAASASFDGTSWAITSPVRFSGNVFLDGVVVPLPGGLPGGVKNVVWSADFSADVPNLSVNWQWTAAAYKALSTDEAALGVKASDSPTALHRNSDHAGTPENYKAAVTGGARGGGGSNYTGSYSGTATVAPDLFAPPATAAQLSGRVSFDGVPDQSVTLNLDFQQADGSWAAVGSTCSDAVTGAYSFGTVPAGTYRITVVPPGSVNGVALADVKSQAGNLNSSPDQTAVASGDTISGVTLAGGTAGTEYDFTLRYASW